MNNGGNYVDTTIVSTPEPKAFSTEHKKKFPRRLSDTTNDESLTGYSSKTFSLLPSRSSEASLELQKQRQLAKELLEITEKTEKTSMLSSLPSRYLKASDVSKQGMESCLNVSGSSTISESDLLRTGLRTLHGDTSTPRDSIVSNSGTTSAPRPSLGQSMSLLSNKLMNTDIDMSKVAAEFKKMLQSELVEEDSNMFTPAEGVEAKLQADELSWRREKDIPAQTSMCFTIDDGTLPMKVSVGEFFKMKSESISDLDIVTTSPVKTEPPVPLIPPEVSLSNTTMTIEGDLSPTQDMQESLSISKIVKVLEDAEQTPRKAVNYLFGNALKKNENIGEDITASEKCRAYLGEQSMAPLKFLSHSSATASDNIYQNKNIQYAPDNKENIDSLNLPSIVGSCLPSSQSTNISTISGKSPNNNQLNTNISSLASVRSVSSLSNLTGGKLPIDASRTELVWGCVKPGKSVTQEVVIRNKSQNRLRFQCAVSGPSYKILKDHPDSEYVSIAKYVFQPGESKRIFISFTPIQIGAAIDSVAFSPTDPSLNQYRSQKINLYGYGGFGNVEVSHVTKDITGKFWLCLGDLGNHPSLSKVIKLHNTGTLPAFGLISFDSKDISSFSNVTVSSDKFILMPQEQKNVTITFHPSPKDYRQFQSCPIMELGVVKIISGSEVTRARITKLSKLATDKKLVVIDICHKLSQHIPGAVVPEDINLFRETIKGVSELLQELCIQEIVLMLEQDPEATLLAQPEDSITFQTLCQDLSYDVANDDKLSFRLEPSSIILAPPIRTENIFVLISDHAEPAYYELKCDTTDLIFTNDKGTINCGETIMINVKCNNVCGGREIEYKVRVVINDYILGGTVKVLKIGDYC